MLYEEAFSRSIRVVGRKGQEKLRKAAVAIIGLGGVGGTAAEALARSGVGELRLVDFDSFELSNLNRQPGSGMKTLGRGKVEVLAERIREINPQARIKVYAEEFDGRNAARILSGCDAAVDGLDNAYSRVLLSKECKGRGIPYVFGAAEGTLGMCSVFRPEGRWNYEKIFGLGKKKPEELKALPRCDSVLGVVANLVGLLEAAQAMKLLLGKRIVESPEFILLELFGKEMLRVERLR